MRLACDLDENADLAMVYWAIDAWMPCLELSGTRWLQGERVGLLRLADQQLNRALVLGAPRTVAWPDEPKLLKRTSEAFKQVGEKSRPRYR